MQGSPGLLCSDAKNQLYIRLLQVRSQQSSVWHFWLGLELMSFMFLHNPKACQLQELLKQTQGLLTCGVSSSS